VFNKSLKEIVILRKNEFRTPKATFFGTVACGVAVKTRNDYFIYFLPNDCTELWSPSSGDRPASGPPSYKLR
jgi:hypothetical protein